MGYYIKKTSSTWWAICKDNEDGTRTVPHVGKPAYIQKIWDSRFKGK